MKKVVLDASIALKWFFNEVDSEKALKLQARLNDKTIQSFVPQIFFFEVINAMKTKPTSTPRDVKRAIRIIINLPFYSEKVNKSLLTKANYFAQKYDLTIYDASYLALAKLLGVNLITADEKLVRKTGLKFIKSLKDFKF